MIRWIKENESNDVQLPTTLSCPDIDIGLSVLSWQMYLPASVSCTPRIIRNQESLELTINYWQLAYTSCNTCLNVNEEV